MSGKIMSHPIQHGIAKLAAVLVMMFVISDVLLAQRIAGKTLGRVIDPSRGVVPGVQVEVLHTISGTARSAVANDVGNYHISLLLVGTYNVTISLQGFKKETVSKWWF